jgi:hypothetical protein
MISKRLLMLMAATFAVAWAMLPLRAQKNADWSSFANQDFEIRYPEGWKLKEGTDFSISSPAPKLKGAEAVEISVRKKSSDKNTLDEAVKSDAGEGRLLQKTELRGPALIESRCGRLYKAVRRASEQDGGAAGKSGEIYTSYYCVNSKGTFELTLRNAQGDPRHRALQQTAREMLATLRPQ